MEQVCVRISGDHWGLNIQDPRANLIMRHAVYQIGPKTLCLVRKTLHYCYQHKNACLIDYPCLNISLVFETESS